MLNRARRLKSQLSYCRSFLHKSFHGDVASRAFIFVVVDTVVFHFMFAVVGVALVGVAVVDRRRRRPRRRLVEQGDAKLTRTPSP